MTMAGFSHPREFTDGHVSAFQNSLVTASSYILSTDEIVHTNATANARRRRGLLGSSVAVSFTVELTLEDHNYTSSNSSSASDYGTSLVKSMATELTSSMNSTGNSSFMSVFTTHASTFNVSVENVSVDVASSSASLSSMHESLEITVVHYTQPPTTAPSPAPTHPITLSPTTEPNLLGELGWELFILVGAAVILIIGVAAVCVEKCHQRKKKLVRKAATDDVQIEMGGLYERGSAEDIIAADNPMKRIPQEEQTWSDNPMGVGRLHEIVLRNNEVMLGSEPSEIRTQGVPPPQTRAIVLANNEVRLESVPDDFVSYEHAAIRNHWDKVGAPTSWHHESFGTPASEPAAQERSKVASSGLHQTEHRHHHHDEHVANELEALQKEFMSASLGSQTEQDVAFDPQIRISFKQSLVMEEMEYWLQDEQLPRAWLSREWKACAKAVGSTDGTLDFEGFLSFVSDIEHRND